MQIRERLGRMYNVRYRGGIPDFTGTEGGRAAGLEGSTQIVTKRQILATYDLGLDPVADVLEPSPRARRGHVESLGQARGTQVSRAHTS